MNQWAYANAIYCFSKAMDDEWLLGVKRRYVANTKTKQSRLFLWPELTQRYVVTRLLSRKNPKPDPSASVITASKIIWSRSRPWLLSTISAGQCDSWVYMPCGHRYGRMYPSPAMLWLEKHALRLVNRFQLYDWKRRRQMHFRTRGPAFCFSPAILIMIVTPFITTATNSHMKHK
jgi:hypothetical protein